tara:strand:+ start:577 stop:1026 length:450 start_codon:yes stop_codon:yes gene_type:complete
MPTIRDTILDALTARLQVGLPTWSVQLRDLVNKGALPLAVVYYVGEDKRDGGNDAYDCSISIAVEISVAPEDADATEDAGNPFKYLSRSVGQVEALIHAPDEWAGNPGINDVRIDGHDVADTEDEDLAVSALLRLTFTYSHALAGPEVA